MFLQSGVPHALSSQQNSVNATVSLSIPRIFDGQIETRLTCIERKKNPKNKNKFYPSAKKSPKASLATSLKNKDKYFRFNSANRFITQFKK